MPRNTWTVVINFDLEIFTILPIARKIGISLFGCLSLLLSGKRGGNDEGVQEAPVLELRRLSPALPFLKC